MAVRAPASSRHRGVNSSPCGKTATPSSPSAASAAPFSRATASTVCMNSWCSRCALLTIARVGAAIAARRAISPGWFMPISMTAALCAALRRNSVRGTPISLFRLPRVASRPSSPWAAARMDAIISLTVVLPLLPVTPMTGRLKRLRQWLAMRPSATRVSATTMAGTLPLSQPAGKRSTTTAATPLAATCSRKSWASKLSPRRATNSEPAWALRLSVDTPAKAREASPASCAPCSDGSNSARLACIRLSISSSSSSSGARTRPAAHGRHRRTAVSCP